MFNITCLILEIIDFYLQKLILFCVVKMGLQVNFRNPLIFIEITPKIHKLRTWALSPSYSV